MSTAEPQHVSSGIAAAREALTRAAERSEQSVPVIDLGDDLDPEVLAAENRRHIEQQRSMRWHVVCPQRFHGATLDTLDADVRRQVEEWLRCSPRPNLVVLGPVGTGKTHAALAAVRDDWFERGIDVRFSPVVELLDQLRPGGDVHAFDELTDIGRLVVDDVGHERPTDWTAERLGALVNRRWLEERPIIATSNLEPNELRTAIGERTYSRLVGSDAVVIRLAGDDRRRKR